MLSFPDHDETSEYSEIIGRLPLSDMGKDFLLHIFENTSLSYSSIVVVINACIDIEQRFSSVIRKSGKPYTFHLYETSKNYLVHTPSASASEIVAALHHDTPEDTNAGFFYFLDQYGFSTALITKVLSKPPYDIPKGADQEQVQEIKSATRKEYFSRFESIEVLQEYIEKIATKNGITLDRHNSRLLAEVAARIKICDRIHNLGTMAGNFDHKYILGKFRETQKCLQDIANEVGMIKALSSALNNLSRVSADNSGIAHSETTKQFVHIADRVRRTLG